MVTYEIANAVVRDAAAAHDLLVRSDLARCVPGEPVPQRNPATTQALVAAGNVHGLYSAGKLIAMVTVGPSVPYGVEPSLFDPAHKPFYMQRLAVDPALTPGLSMAGLRCVRTAIEVARRSGADALRAETNAALTNTVTLLARLGFHPCRRQTSAAKISLELQLKGIDDERHHRTSTP